MLMIGIKAKLWHIRHEHGYITNLGRFVVVALCVVLGLAVSTVRAENFGHTTQFGSTQNTVRRIQIATQVTLSSGMNVASITAYLGEKNQDVSYAIYTDASGEPDTLIAETAVELMGQDWGWKTIALPVTSLSAGTYWLALSMKHNLQSYVYESTGGQTRYNDNNAVMGSYSSSWGASTVSSTRRISIYASSGFQITSWQEVEP